MDELEARVKRQEDMEEIIELTYRYCHMVWQNAGPAMADLFTEGGLFSLWGREPVIGREALRHCYVEITVNNPRRPLPYIHNHVVDLDGDRATMRCYLDLRHAGGIAGVIYDDVCERTTEGWRFSERRCSRPLFRK